MIDTLPPLIHTSFNSGDWAERRCEMENGDWIEHSGGPCPLPAPPKYELRFADGVEIRISDPRGYDWEHEFFSGDRVTAYRVVKS